MINNLLINLKLTSYPALTPVEDPALQSGIGGGLKRERFRPFRVGTKKGVRYNG